MEGSLALVIDEAAGDEGGAPQVQLRSMAGTIQADLRIGVSLQDAVDLMSNDGLASEGVKPHGMGFVLERSERDALLSTEPRAISVVRPYVNGRDLQQKTRDVFIIDLFGLQQAEVRTRLPNVYQWVVERVKPERDQNNRATYRDNWWIFGEPRRDLRPALSDLTRYIATVKTAKHRVFAFVPATTIADSKLIVVALAEPAHLGVLSSRVHLVWALAVGARLGVGDDPTYVKSKCFDQFPFPVFDGSAARVGGVATELDEHRKARQAAHPDLTITGMYNVLEKLRSDDALSAKDKVIHEQGLVSVLKKLHDDLDAAVFDAYGWPHDLTDEQILERLVALNKERAEEEKRGLVRWLRPEFQNPSSKAAPMQQVELPTEPNGDDEDEDGKPALKAKATVPSWPKKLAEQIATVRDLVTKSSTEWSAENVAANFKGAKIDDVSEVLDSLAALGLLVTYELVEGRRWRSSAFVSASPPPI
ncbi:MAG: type IIL restriction-modification enzyme MmeI [Polyangiaceae bacterium]|nr:type IIL restriction-modification enzyme MmeI [Polyangiaceae bacterium]